MKRPLFPSFLFLALGIYVGCQFPLIPFSVALFFLFFLFFLVLLWTSGLVDSLIRKFVDLLIRKLINPNHRITELPNHRTTELPNQRLTLSFIVFLDFFLLGYTLVLPSIKPKLPSNHIIHYISKSTPLDLEGTLSKSSQASSGRTRLHIKLDSLHKDGKVEPVIGEVLISVRATLALKYGDRVRFRAILRMPRNFNNPGNFDYERFLALQHIYMQGSLRNPESIAKIGQNSGNGFFNVIEGIRDNIRDLIQSELKNPERGVLLALLIGDRTEIDEEISEAFNHAGVSHILSISGLHFGIVAFLFFFLFKTILRFSETLILHWDVKSLAALATLPLVLFYTLISGGSIPTLRAFIMIGAYLLILPFKRETDSLNLLFLSAYIILLFHPLSLYLASFQLSFMAVFFIIYFYPKIVKKEAEPSELQDSKLWRLVDSIKRKTILSISLSFITILGTAPILAFHFHKVYLVGIIANLVIVPLMGFIIVSLGLLTIFIYFFSYYGALFLLKINYLLLKLAIYGVFLFGKLSFLTLSTTTPTFLEITLFYLIVFSLFEIKKKAFYRYVFTGALILLIIDSIYWYRVTWLNQELRVTFLSVGQGDCTLVELPKGRKMIIDGGGFPDSNFDVGERVVAPFLWKWKIHRLDYLVCTHPHSDHLTGLRFLAKNFKVKEIWTNGMEGNFEEFWDLKRIVKEKKINEIIISRESPERMINGVVIGFLNPPKKFLTGYGKGEEHRVNNNSIVMELSFQDVSFLFTGDIEKEAEEDLARRNLLEEITVLKVPHHGSSTSSSLKFLNMIRPRVAVFQLGYGNWFNFPHREVLERYQKVDSTIYRTDMDGAVEMKTYGGKFFIKTFLKKDSPYGIKGRGERKSFSFSIIK